MPACSPPLALPIFFTSTPSLKTSPPAPPPPPPSSNQVLVIENPLYLPDAIKRLRASMQDPILAIDLEWRPAFGPKFTPVAMIQIASSRMALLIRTCRMQYRLAPELLALLQDPGVRFVGFGWDSADEGKMQGTFSVGAASFPGFLDLQSVAGGLGWHGYGLARLTKAVLGTPLPKSRKVTMSNWETRTLSRPQVRLGCQSRGLGVGDEGGRLWVTKHGRKAHVPTAQPLLVVDPG